ncbi:ABC transporter permease subunit [Microbacterium sp. No. 7]|uniref:ABC transporter permease subunit n=1 Tax=Microbacterium sp. No. 7 TaxID=1714373 RepID=UPI001E59C597|nr:ABC transporter permease [Microbacterium sp. No. 7]
MGARPPVRRAVLGLVHRHPAGRPRQQLVQRRERVGAARLARRHQPVGRGPRPRHRRRLRVRVRRAGRGLPDDVDRPVDHGVHDVHLGDAVVRRRHRARRRLRGGARLVPLGRIRADRARRLRVWLWHLWLPAIALSFDTVADVARQMRVGLVQAYRDNYVTGAVVRGLSPRRIFFVHVLRNGSGPALTVLGMKFPNLLGGAVVTEAIFGLAGYGKFAADSASRGDVPAVQGVLVVAIVLVVLFNLLVNVLLVRLNPASARGV